MDDLRVLYFVAVVVVALTQLTHTPRGDWPGISWAKGAGKETNETRVKYLKI